MDAPGTKEIDMEITIKCDKKDYFNCSMYYIRRYFGLREIILMLILLVAGILLLLFANTVFILVMFGLTVAVLLFTVILFVWTSVSGYKHDLVKQGIAYNKINFDEKQMNVAFLDKGGEHLLDEIYEYSKIEAVVIKKDFIYIYAGIAIFFYVKRKNFDEETFLKLCNYLRENVPAEKFKFKTVKRIYPKKKKVTIDGSEENKK